MDIVKKVNNTEKILIVCDTGIDDALALAYAAARKEKKLVGIIAGFGVARATHTFRNSLHLVNLLGIDVPVVMGSTVPISRPGRDYDTLPGIFHGQDGMGNLLGPSVTPCNTDHTEDSGAAFIVKMAEQYGKELAIVTTGPLTDLARGLTAESQLPEKIGAVISMAGALATPGNVNEFAEANVKADPEAAKIVLESDLPLILIGLDVTRKTLFRKTDLKRWQQINTEAARFLSAAMGFYLKAYARRYTYLEGCALHDPLAIGAAFNPEWLTLVPMHLTAVTGGVSDGRTCENLSSCGDAKYTGFGAFDVDAAAFEKDFFTHTEELLHL
jgi:purine nucleosidase